MRRFDRVGAAVLLAVVVSVGCGDFGDPLRVPAPDPNPSGGPELESVVPARTFPGDRVVLRGVDFGETAGRVLFTGGAGTIDAVIVAWSDTEIEVVVPEGAEAGPVVVSAGGSTSDPIAFTPTQEMSLRNDVRPILLGQGCLSCHGGSGGLFLDTHAKILQGGGRGPAVVPGESATSLLVRSLRGEGGVPLMPQGASESIPEAQILVIADWIDQGARDN